MFALIVGFLLGAVFGGSFRDQIVEVFNMIVNKIKEFLQPR